MKLLADRVKYAIHESEQTPSSVARKIGCTPAAVLQWISGDTKNIKNDLLFALADATGFEARWIGTGEGPERPLAAMNHRINDLVRNYVERGNPDSATRWRRMEKILSEPTQPADLLP